MELMEKIVPRNATAHQVTPAIISVENVSNVRMTHLETGVNKLVTVTKMQQRFVLILMEDASVNLIGSDQSVISTVPLGFLMVNVSQVWKIKLALVLPSSSLVISGLDVSVLLVKNVGLSRCIRNQSAWGLSWQISLLLVLQLSLSSFLSSSS